MDMDEPIELINQRKWHWDPSDQYHPDNFLLCFKCGRLTSYFACYKRDISFLVFARYRLIFFSIFGN